MAERIYTIKSGLKPEPMAAPAQPATVGAAGSVGDVASYNANTAGVPTANVAEVASASQTAGRVYRKKSSLTAGTNIPTTASQRTYTPKLEVSANKVKHQTQLVRDWFEEAEGVISSTQDYVKANENKWNKAYAAEYTDSVKKLLQSAGDIAPYFEHYKEDEEAYTALNEAYTEFQNYLANFDVYAKEMRDFYGKWGSEKEYKEADAAQREFEAYLKEDEDALKNQIQLYSDLLEMVDEYRHWQQMDVPNGYNLSEVRSQLQDLSRKLNYYGFAPYDAYGNPLNPEQELKKKKAATEEKLRNVEDAKTLNRVNGYIEEGKNSGEFEKYVKKGESIKNPTYMEAMTPVKIFGWTPLGNGETVNNPVTYTLANRDKILLSSITAKGDESVDGLVQAVFFMTEEQVDNYNYLIAKHGRATADDYLELVRKEVKADQTERIFTKYLKGKKYKELAFSAIHGIDQFATGISSAMGSDYADTRVLDPQAVGSLVREDLSTVGDGVDVFGSSLGQVAYDFGVTTSNMVPSIAAGAVANVVVPGSGAFVTPALMGLSSGGNAYREALAMGYTKEQAREYGFLVGTSEALLEKVLGTLGPAGNSVVGNGIKNAVSGIENGFLRFGINLTGKMLADGAEEFLQEILTPFFENIALDADNTWSDIDWKMAGYSAVMGALSAGLMDGAVTPTTSVMAQHVRKNAQYRSLGKTFIDGVDGATIDKAIAIGMDNAKGTDARIAAEKISEKVKAGKKVSAYAVGRMVAESQTEQAQVSKAIEREVVESGRRVGYNAEVVDTVARAAVALNQRVRFATQGELQNRNNAAEYHPETGMVLLNPVLTDTNRLIGKMLAHEMTHAAEGTAQLQKLERIAQRMEGDKWESLKADVKSEYAKVGKQLSDPEVKREALAHWIVENLFRNKAFAKAVVDGDANVGNAFFYMIDRLRRAMGAKKASAGNLAMLERLFMQALDNRTLGPRDGDVQGAIINGVVDENGNHYPTVVLLDTDFFDGLSPRNWGKKLREYVESRSENNPLILPVEDENGNVQQIQFADKSDRVTKDGHSNHRVLDKLSNSKDNISKLAVVHIDEILTVSEEGNPYYTSENNHQWLDKKGWLHRTAHIVNAKNGAIYQITIDIAKARDGRHILYATDGKINRVGNVNVDSLKNRGPWQNPNSNTNVAQKTPGVKPHSMQEGAGIYSHDVQDGVQDGVQGALLPPEYRPGARAEGVDPNANVEGDNPSVTADAVPPPFTQGRHAADAANGADLSIDEAAVLESAVRSQLQGKQKAAMDTSSAEGIKDVNPYLDKLVAELGPQEVLRRMYNATRMDRPTGMVEIDGKRVDAGAYVDAYEQSLPKDKAALERHIERLQEQRTEEMVKLEQEGALEDYHFGGLKIDLQLFAATRLWDLLQLDEGEDGTEVRQFYEKRLRGTDAIHNQELIDMLATNEETYNPIGNKDTLAKARKKLESDKHKAKILKRIGSYNRWDKFDAVEVAEGIELIRRAINDGEIGVAADLITGLSRKGTEAGRAVQAFSMMARLTPEGTLKAAIKTVKADADYAICEGANEGLDVLADDIARAIKEAEGKGLTSDEIADRIRNGVVGKDAPVQFDHVPQDLADQVSEATGADVTGYTIVVSTEAMQAIADGGANVETLVDTDAETLQIIVRDGTDTGTIETAAAQQLIKGKKRLPAKLTREELVQLLSEDLAGEKGNFFTQEEIYDLLWKTVDEATNIPEQLKRYVLKKIRKDDGGLAQRIYELHKRGDLKQTKLRRAMEEALELPTLTDEDMEWIVKQGAKIESLQDKPVEQADAMEEVYRYLGAKMYVNGWDKFEAWRKFAMLFNLKTHVRNEVSNAVYVPVRKTDSLVATVLEMLLVKDPDQRAAAFGWRCTSHGQQIIETIKARVPEAVLEMRKQGAKYEVGGVSKLKQYRQVFGKRKFGQTVQKLNDWNSARMDKSDEKYFKIAYVDALGQVMTARNATEVTQEMHNIAMQRALEATFRAKLVLGEVFTFFKQWQNSSNSVKRAVAAIADIEIPFTRTPANIFHQSYMHSPIGLVFGGIQTIRSLRGKSNRAVADSINNLAKGLTGTLIYAIALIMAKNGLIKTGYGKSEKERAADEMAGIQENSFTVMGVNISFDWLQPVASPFVAGAVIGEAMYDDDVTFKTFFGSAAASVDGLFGLSMLQSLYDFFGGYDAGVVGSLTSIGENAISQSNPTLLGQIARIIDPVQRKTDGEWFGEAAIKQVMAKIPGLTFLLDPELDVWGNEVYRTGKPGTEAVVLNTLQQTFFPSNFKVGTGKDDPVSQEILRLYNTLEEDSGDVIPTSINRKDVPEGEDWTELNKLLGGANRLAVEEFIQNERPYDIEVETGRLTEKGTPQTMTVTKYYRDMTDEERAKVLSNIYSNNKEEVLGKNEHLSDDLLNDGQRYARELIGRTKDGEKGNFTSMEAQDPTELGMWGNDVAVTGENDSITQEIWRLYNTLPENESNVLPSKITAAEAREMGEDWAEVQTLLGGANRLAVEELVNNKKAYAVEVETGKLTEKGNPQTKKVTKYYRDMTDDERRRVLKRIYTANEAEVKGNTEGKTDKQLTDNERYIRDLLRRVREGERGTYDTVDEQAQQTQQEDTSYYEDLLRRMRNGY